MLLIILVTALAGVAIGATVRALSNDGYRAVPTDPRRLL